MSALAADPPQTVWDALDANDCDPRGPLHQFTARCPAHDDHAPSLAVGVGADGRALLWCHAGCSARDVVAALDLAWPALFPPGHRHSPIQGLAKPRPFVDLVLEALRELGVHYRPARDAGMWVCERCPVCDWPGGWPLWITEDDRRRVTLSCGGGCSQAAILDELAGEPAS